MFFLSYTPFPRHPSAPEKQDVHVPGVPEIGGGKTPSGLFFRPAPDPRARHPRRDEGADARGQERGACSVRRGEG